MKFLQIRGRTLLVIEAIASQRRPSSKELAHQRSIEDLAERARQRRLGATRVTDRARELLKRIERRRIDTSDQRIAQPGEGLIHVAEVCMDNRCGTPHECPSGLSAITRAL